MGPLQTVWKEGGSVTNCLGGGWVCHKPFGRRVGLSQTVGKEGGSVTNCLEGGWVCHKPFGRRVGLSQTLSSKMNAELYKTTKVHT